MNVYVNSDRLVSDGTAFLKCESVISSVQSTLASVKRSLDYRFMEQCSAGVHIDRVSSRLTNRKKGIKNIRSTLSSVRSEYRRAEQNNMGLVGNATTTSGSGSTANATTSGGNVENAYNERNIWLEGIIETASKFGFIGSVVGLIGGFVTGGISDHGGITHLKNLFGVVEEGSSLWDKLTNTASGSKASFNWKSLLGLTDDAKDSFSWAKYTDDYIDGFKMTGAKSTAGNIAAGAKWAGTMLGVAAEAYENFTDPENSTTRAFFETIGESAVDIGLGYAAAGVATAGLAAVGAPVVLAGAVGAVAVWAGNVVCEHFTGKDMGELVSDAVLDTCETAVEWTKDTCKAIGDGAKKAAKGVSTWWKNTFGW